MTTSIRSITSHAPAPPWPPEAPPPDPLAQCFAPILQLFSPPPEPPLALTEEEPTGADPSDAAPPPPAAETDAPPAEVEAVPAAGTAVPPAAKAAASPAAKPFSLGFSSAPLAPAQPLPAKPAALNKSASHQLAGAGHYLSWRDEFTKEIENGRKPSPALLSMLEASLYKLSEEDLHDEYRWFAERYMSDDSSDLLRAACEMIVIHIGEVVNMPQGARVAKRKHDKRLNAVQVTPRVVSAEDAALQDGHEIVQGGPDFLTYKDLADAMLGARQVGSKPPMGQFAELDARLMLLHQADMVDEYKRYAGLYLDDAVNNVGVLGFCEMRLIRLGEALFLPLATRLILLRSDPRLNALESSNEGLQRLFAIAAGAKASDLAPAELPRIVASQSFAATVATAASVGAGGALLDANGVPVIGADGKPMFATDERVPPGGTIGAGGVILGPDGQPVLGPDGQPMYVVIAAAHEAVKPPAAEVPVEAAAPPAAEAAQAAAAPSAEAAAVPGVAPAAAPPATPPPAAIAAPMTPPVVPSAPAVPATPGSVLQYAKSISTPIAKASKGISSAMKRPASPKATPPRDPKKFELPPMGPGPSVVAGEGQGGQGRLYETTEDGQLIIPGNWFERMKEREYLGGMKRTPEQMQRLSLHAQLASTAAKAKPSALTGATVIESVGTDARPEVKHMHPQEYEAMQSQLVGELAAFLSGPGNVRSKLKSTAVTRAVPWQEQIASNPRSMLKPVSPSKANEPQFVNA